MQIKNMLVVDEETLIGVCRKGIPQTVFTKVDITAVPCIFIHDEPQLLIDYKQPLRIEHKSKETL
jgi:hypothetical protein